MVRPAKRSSALAERENALDRLHSIVAGALEEGNERPVLVRMDAGKLRLHKQIQTTAPSNFRLEEYLQVARVSKQRDAPRSLLSNHPP